MQPTLPHYAAVSQILDKEISALEAVMDVLQAEHDALESRDAEALTAASQRKLELIETARRVGEERAQLLPEGVDVDANPEIGRRWDKLAKLARSCKDKNEHNGTMIRWQHKYVEQTLAVLRNDGSAGTTYGKDGNRPGPVRQNTLGSA